ncbi:ferrochelatase [Legionella drancourtii]|uniref:Ferrochelatase n=1 Tax=Legionella drancourtii LLAP12 TaxID=658187 RepID=G9ET43_9GAMM|nr:ferrochelatase [Legionella drancourtii]EHL29510.1 ferrochelatase [Legionella drancourtii LLAP12]
MKRGLLLINLGTPKSAKISAVRDYLRTFLTDKRVIDLPALLRYVLVYAFILPFRTKRSARAYQAIWTAQGSPLLYHSENLAHQVQKEVGPDYEIALGMRYGEPSIASALERLKSCDTITILPLYPQYSSAANGSSIEEAMRIISSWDIIPTLTIIRDFFQHPAYIKAQTKLIKDYLPESEHVLFSYHGIPERQITKNECKSVCSDDCPVLTESNQKCYKAQCHQSSRLLANELQLAEKKYSTAFQSRLGRTPWIKPYTDEVLTTLATQGVKKLVIACPSFVADCLETLEEINIRAKQQWLALGGEQLIVVPCLNEQPLWVKAITEISHLKPKT